MPITHDITITAEYVEAVYITYIQSFPNGDRDDEKIVNALPKGRTLLIHSPVPRQFSGYKFDGWYTYGSGTYGGEVDFTIPIKTVWDMIVKTKYSSI